MDVGKTFKASVVSVQSAAKTLLYYAGIADKICGKTIPVDGDYFTYTRLEPVGVVGAILPVKFIISLCTILMQIFTRVFFSGIVHSLWCATKSGAALAAGCTLVVKPAEQTPLTTLHFASLVLEVSYPYLTLYWLKMLGHAHSTTFLK